MLEIFDYEFTVVRLPSPMHIASAALKGIWTEAAGLDLSFDLNFPRLPPVM